MTIYDQNPWWAVARSEEVTGKKPLSVDIGDQPLVLWRDTNGLPRALEDRCPHRRAPLSLGCIRDNGWIQCGYHGWSYDGETGRLKEIPNMKDEQRFPPVYRAKAFSVAENGGFVWVNLASEAASAPSLGRTMKLAGTSYVPLDQSCYLDALYDDPSLLIEIRGVDFTSYLASELREENGLLMMERNCLWGKVHWPAFALADFPITLLSRTHPLTGETELALRDTDFNVLLTARMAPVPAPRGVTAVRWRAEVGKTLNGLHARRLGFGTPFKVREAIDGAALRVLKPSVSLHGKQLRSSMAADSPVPAAA